jgi:primosomal protein N' (replication factor Y)
MTAARRPTASAARTGTGPAGGPKPFEPAAADPVARLMVDVPLPHLDRPFDYLVPAELDATVHVGSRVRVRFAGRLVDGYVLERGAASEHPGRLARIERAVGSEPVLTAATTRLFRAVADRWAGSFVDVVRLGVPARHARAESSSPVAATPASQPAPDPSFQPAPDPASQSAADAATHAAPDRAVEPVPRPDPAQWARYTAGVAFLTAIRAGQPARAVWAAAPGDDPPARLADAVQAALAAGRGALVVVADARDLARLDAAVTTALGPGQHVALSADLGPAERYRRWIAVRRGTVRAVIGTRAAAFAPVADLGLVAVWDDGDDLHVEPRAPYPNVRDVLALRSSLEGAALLIGGYARTAEAQLLVDSGWAHAITAPRAMVRAGAPRVTPTGDDFELERDPAAVRARLPSLALRTARAALALDRPVLVQVPRAGYAPSLACVRDRTPARCSFCSGPLAAAGSAGVARCRWCARPATDWACPVCGGRAMRAVVIGARRTAEELGRAFPGARVRTSGGDAVLDRVEGGAELVVATPGAEPVAPGGYGAALLLDGWTLLSRADLRAGEEALRRWFNAAALVAADGQVVIAADAGVAAVQALVRWDPVGHAVRELADRAELGFPPATRMTSITGAAPAIQSLLAVAELPASADRIGPVELDRPFRPGDAPTPGARDPDAAEQRLLIRVPRRDGPALARALHAAAAVRSARKDPDPLRIALDPATLA